MVVLSSSFSYSPHPFLSFSLSLSLSPLIPSIFRLSLSLVPLSFFRFPYSFHYPPVFLSFFPISQYLPPLLCLSLCLSHSLSLCHSPPLLYLYVSPKSVIISILFPSVSLPYNSTFHQDSCRINRFANSYPIHSTDFAFFKIEFYIFLF